MLPERFNVGSDSCGEDLAAIESMRAMALTRPGAGKVEAEARRVSSGHYGQVNQVPLALTLDRNPQEFAALQHLHPSSTPHRLSRCSHCR